MKTMKDTLRTSIVGRTLCMLLIGLLTIPVAGPAACGQTAGGAPSQAEEQPPAAAVTPGEIAGKYVGATAEAAWAGGLGANILVGGSKKGFALQPLSVEGYAGLNLAVGVVEVELKQAK